MKKETTSLPDTLYHYCSNEAFHAIVSNQSIRLSSLSLSNDAMEGKLISETIKTLTLDKETIKNSHKNATIYEGLFEGLGFCLSKKGDLLSQWRGYANDATGVSIGFSTQYLQQLKDQHAGSVDSDFNLERIEYDQQTQKDILTSRLNKILAAEEDLNTASKATPNLKESLLRAECLLLRDMYRFKNDAFQEELEWRLLSLIICIDETLPNCDFQAKGNKITPFRTLELDPLGCPAITHVILGPKNITPENVIKQFLNTNGFVEVKVNRAKASYR